jgi:DUF1365 family protein
VNSRLYSGYVQHQRRGLVSNGFRYRIYFAYLDLAELDEVDSSLRLFSYDRAGLFSFHERDHGPRDGTPLRPWIDALLARAGIDLEGGPVRLLTFPRVLGARFYPVSFWYCFHRDGTPRAMLAEVHNTVGDRHNYLLHNAGAPLDWNAAPTAVKAFWVSPFIPVGDARYEFRFSEPGEKLSVSLLDYVAGDLVLTASLQLAAEPLTDRALLRRFLSRGPMSVVAFALIVWQAARLLAKGVRFLAHTPPPDEETSL